MENLQKQIDEITKKINAIDVKMEDLEQRKQADKVDLGVISITNGKVTLELLLDEKLFDDKDMERLQGVAEELQLLLIDIEKKINN